MTAQLIQEMDTPQKYKPPQEVVAEWMIYFQRTERREPTVRELAEASGLSRSRAGEYRRAYLAARKIS